MTGRCKKIAIKTMAGFLAIWLSGFLFLIGCHGQNQDAFSCPLMKMGAHCDLAERQKNAEKVSLPTTDDGIDCCAFIPAFFDKTRTNDGQTQTVIASPVAIIEQIKDFVVRTNFSPARPYIAVSIARNDTFLKNRTFRI